MHEGLADFTVSTQFVRLLTEYALSCDMDVDDLARTHGLEPMALEDSEGRVSFSAYASLLDGLASQLNEPHIGLLLGPTARLAHLGTSGLAQIACSTVSELLPRMARYNSLLSNAFEDDVDVVNDELILRWHQKVPEGFHISRHHAELNFALTQSLIPHFTGEQVFPTRVAFRHPPPDNPLTLEEFFHCEVQFNAPVDAMSCDASILERTLHAPDPVTLQMLDRICEQQLKALEELQEPDWLLGCKQAITKSLSSGQPELSSIAKDSGYEVRRLRHLLSERGLNFRALVDTCRNNLAQAYIVDPNLSLVDVAMLLGFSEQSAFQRAYRRWTGESPGSTRRRLLATEPPSQ